MHSKTSFISAISVALLFFELVFIGFSLTTTSLINILPGYPGSIFIREI